MTTPNCLACGGAMQAFTDKRGKPYAQCTPCGAQFFVRTKQGVERFTARYGTPEKKGTATPPAAPKEPTKPATRSEPAKPAPAGEPSGEKKWWW
jgi:DNA-directed RNA polymerase subunit RPC12/RpoP